ncbi:uncharacterized protein V6R79_006168 [Siganus canaliculatus]
MLITLHEKKRDFAPAEQSNGRKPWPPAAGEERRGFLIPEKQRHPAALRTDLCLSPEASANAAANRQMWLFVKAYFGFALNCVSQVKFLTLLH